MVWKWNLRKTMGDYADYTCERDMNAWVEDGCPGIPVRAVFGHIKCKYCGEEHLKWEKNPETKKWVLTECPGYPSLMEVKIHQCRKPKDKYEGRPSHEQRGWNPNTDY